LLKEAQEVLSHLGVYTGPRDGIPGSATRSAIKNFQSAHGLPATGYVDPATEKLFKDAEKQTTKFEGETVTASEEQREIVNGIVVGHGLKSSLAIPIVFDAVVHSGPARAKRYADQASKTLGGSPLNGVSERAWLLSFLQARTEHVEKALPQHAKRIDEVRISKLRAQVEALPE
jgi:peptidoglycan hydrolase-like protein with peptidoglycan-binding domain